MWETVVSVRMAMGRTLKQYADVTNKLLIVYHFPIQTEGGGKGY